MESIPTNTDTTEYSKKDLFARYSDLVSTADLNKYTIYVIGLGAIGSNLAKRLYQMGCENMSLWDFDTVSAENIGVQNYPESMIGFPKADAMELIFNFNRQIPKDAKIKFNNSKFRAADFKKDGSNKIVFLCLDSMKYRKLITETIKEDSSVKLIADTRMSAETLLTMIFTPDKFTDYAKTLYSDEEAHQESCTRKSTTYCVDIVTGLAIANYKYWLRNLQEPKNYYSDYIWCLDGNDILPFTKEVKNGH